jgi:predicted dehydrogenase
MRRVAVIGCGLIGAAPPGPAGIQSHAAAWAVRRDARLLAVADPDRSRLDAACRAFRVRQGFSSPTRLLDEVRPEIVSLCTPDETHGTLLARILRTPSVVAVLAEKPLTLEVEEAERLVALAEERNVLLAVNYCRRTAPSHRRLRTWLSQGRIGPIEAVRGVYVRGLKHNGTHWLDLARFLVGEIAEIRGFGRSDPDALDATIDVSLRFANGARGELVGLRTPAYSCFEMDLIGAAGRVKILDGGRRFELSESVPSAAFAGFHELAPAAGPTGDIDDLLFHAVDDLMTALREGRPPAGTGANAVTALRLAEQALRDTRSTHSAPGLHAAAHR